MWKGSKVVEFTVRNTHDSREGFDTAQVYVGYPAAAGEPPKQLRGFAKMSFGAGQERRLRIALPVRAMSVWDVEKGDWVVPEGEFTVHVGRSSRDIKLKDTFRV